MTSRLLLSFFAACTLAASAEPFVPAIDTQITRPWPGKDFWANPAEDWTANKGRLENNFSGGNRNVVLLTAALGAKPAAFTARVRIDQISYEVFGSGFVGFQLGLRGATDDFREAAVAGKGFAAGIDFTGRPFIGSTVSDGAPLTMPLRDLVLELKGEPASGGAYTLTVQAIDRSGKTLASASTAVDGTWLPGLIALTSSTQVPTGTPVLSIARPPNLPDFPQAREGEARFAFSEFSVDGDKFEPHPERAFGPNLWTTYTFDNDGTLCLLAQAATFARNEKPEADLILAERNPQNGTYDPVSRTLRFRVLKLDPAKDQAFEIRFAGASFKGLARHAPTGRPLKLASLSCADAAGFPHRDLVAGVTAQSPDLIAFLGDQIDLDTGGYGAAFDHRSNDRTLVCYLRKYALHGWIWRDLLRDTPSITLPDDRDVFQTKIWGAAGKPADVSHGYGVSAQDSGGYKMSVEFVNAVHRTQTGNLPDAGDPSPCRSGISVYFTRYAYGPLDLIVLADRQFKSAPAILMPQAKVVNGWPTNTNWDPENELATDTPELLGIRQENYLGRWAKSPAKGTKFRIALSQAPFCAIETLPAGAYNDNGLANLKIYPPGEYPTDDQPKPDLDSNGWPRTARLKAVKFLTEAHAVHLTGDRRLGSTGQYGAAAWGDGAWWVSSPAMTNLQPHRWMPAAEGKNRRPGDPRWTGDFEDAFGNHLTIHAVANPTDIEREPSPFCDRAPGYSLTTWDPSSGRVKIENWPAWASPAKAAPDNKPYAGWPITIDPATGKRVD